VIVIISTDNLINVSGHLAEGALPSICTERGATVPVSGLWKPGVTFSIALDRFYLLQRTEAT
jgi:hypothetical protein